MIRAALLIAVLAFAPAADKPPTGTGPNFNELSRQEVPEDIPRDRCILAIYGAELRKETGLRIEGWRPPISENMRLWLYVQRANGNLRLAYCDESGI